MRAARDRAVARRVRAVERRALVDRLARHVMGERVAAARGPRALQACLELAVGVLREAAAGVRETRRHAQIEHNVALRVDHTWIPLADGTRLAARLWLPDDDHERPVPALLEYLPYRKGDAFAARDSRHHAYFAAHGYAGVRVDLRGTGDSDGILLDEYLPQEQDDALEVIAWLAAQPWCSGAVGMIGISWGGFNGLQIAARRPPALGAVVSMCASDDRYSDDVHYKGGCVLATDMLPWAATMLTSDALPPDPAAVGGGMARDMDAAPRGNAADDRGLARPPAPGRLLAPRLGDRGLRRDRDPGVGRGRLGGRLHERRPAPGRGPARAAAAASSARGRTPSPRTARPVPRSASCRSACASSTGISRGAGDGGPDGPALLAWLQDPVAPATHYTERPGRWVADPVTTTEAHALMHGGGPRTHASPLATGAQPAPGVPTAARATGRRTSARRTPARSPSTSSRAASRSRSSARPPWRCG